MRWKAFQLVNIQSWEDGTIELKTDGLTVIKARSETGKSVFIKCLRLGLFFENYTPKERQSIIRNNHKEGHMDIHLIDGTIVRFHFTPTYVITIALYPDGTSERFERDETDKVAKLINLITCRGSTRILNILDNESPMLYDGTDADYNNSVMGVYLNHPDLNRRKENCEQIIQNIKRKIEVQKNLIVNIEESLPLYKPLYNLDEFKNATQVMTHIHRELSLLEKIYPEIINLKTNKPKPTVDLNNFASVMSHLKVLNNLKSELAYLSDCNTIKAICDLTELENLTQQLFILRDLYDSLNAISKESFRKTVKGLEYLKDLITQIQQLQEMQQGFKDLHGYLLQLKRIKEDSRMLSHRWEQFKEEHPTCPVCRQPLKGVSL